MRTAIVIAYYRGKVAKPLEGLGAMVAVGLSPDEVVAYLTPGVVVACHNSPNSVTLSGDNDSVDHVIKSIKTANSDTLCRRLTVKIAYHSGKSPPCALIWCPCAYNICRLYETNWL